MSLSLKRVVAGAAAVALAGVGLVATSGSASALSTPGYEPDANSQGYITFYNAAGQQVTGGNNLAHLADYALVSTPGRTGATKATLYFAIPDHTKATGAWNAPLASASTTFPNTTAPAPLNSATNPLVSLGATDANLQSVLATAVLDTTPGYAGYIQVRVKDSGIGLTSTTSYWETDIAFNTTTGTWSVEYPAAAYPAANKTTTTVTATPVSGAVNNEQSEVFTASVAGNTAPGTITFADGGTTLGTVKTVGVGGSVNSDTVTLPAGTHNITAVFTPGTPAAFTAGDAGSTGSLSYVVNLLTHPTTTTLTLDSASFAQPSAATGKAVVTDDAAANVTSGAVQFQLDGANIGSPVAYDTTKNGFPFSISTSSLSIANHTLAAVFQPVTSATHQLGTSTSAQATFAVTQATFKPDQQSIQTVINPGTITISTPYSGDNGLCAVGTDPANTSLLGKLYLKSTGALVTDSTVCGFLFLPAMNLNANATLYSTTGTFGNIQVTDTRPGNNPYTLSALASNLTKVGGGGTADETINGQYVGLTGVVLDSTNALAPYNTFTSGLAAGSAPAPFDAVAGTGFNFSGFDNPAATNITSASLTGSQGLGGASPHAVEHAMRGLGTATFHGALAINAPTNTRDGVYAGTVTFTVIGS